MATAIVLRRVIVAPIGRLAANVRRTAERGLRGARDVERGRPRGRRAGRRRRRDEGRIVAELEALAAARDDLERSNTELEQFAYVASHDLQEPLRKVARFTQMLQRRYEGQLDERADQYIGFAVDGAKRMQDLINDLLAFSRVGRLREDFTEVDLDAGRGARDREPSRRTARPSRSATSPTVRGEARLLEVVFANLISNGLKFRGEDPPMVRVSASSAVTDEWCFTVADNGIGIDPEYADRIFIIFQRLHPRSAYDGTGIGLAMCRKIIEYHGGRIWLEHRAPPKAPASTSPFRRPGSA